MKILYVEDDPGLGDLLSKTLRLHNHIVAVAQSFEIAEKMIEHSMPDILVCDHDLPDGTGLELIQKILVSTPELPCLMLTGVGNEALAVEAMKTGARDYIVKDIENNFLELIPTIIDRINKERNMEIELALIEQKNDRLVASNRYLSTSLKKQANRNTAIGQSVAFKHALNLIEQVAPTEATVLITGETGTGKEMAAQQIHDMSPRSHQPIITVNCSALPIHLVESELFGHVKGAFTGAISAHSGRFEAADGGTLFLDEIGEMPIELQPKLLRALQESRFEPVGSTKTKKVDVRIIAATNQDLQKKIFNHSFRQDLYYRLNVIPLHIPALRNRKSDIELLFMHFLRESGDRHNLPSPAVSDALLRKIRDYSWPGNIRELSNFVERGIITQRWDLLSMIPTGVVNEESTATCTSNLETLSDVERTHIVKTLHFTKGVISGANGAATILGLNANTLRSRMKKLAIKKSAYLS